MQVWGDVNHLLMFISWVEFVIWNAKIISWFKKNYQHVYCMQTLFLLIEQRAVHMIYISWCFFHWLNFFLYVDLNLRILKSAIVPSVITYSLIEYITCLAEISLHQSFFVNSVKKAHCWWLPIWADWEVICSSQKCWSAPSYILTCRPI